MRAIIASLVLLLVVSSASASQVHPEDVSRADVLAQSPLVVVAEPGERITKSLALGDGVTPFGWTEQAWTVVEVLRPWGDVRPGTKITLTTFSARDLSIHIDYEVHGIGKSPIVPRYTAKVRPGPDEPAILYLRRAAFLRFDGGTGDLAGDVATWRLAVEGAKDATGAKGAVAAAAAKPCDCDASIAVTVGAEGVTDALRARIDAALDARVGRDRSWSVVELRPKAGGD